MFIELGLYTLSSARERRTASRSHTRPLVSCMAGVSICHLSRTYLMSNEQMPCIV